MFHVWLSLSQQFQQHPWKTWWELAGSKAENKASFCHNSSYLMININLTPKALNLFLHCSGGGGGSGDDRESNTDITYILEGRLLVTILQSKLPRHLWGQMIFLLKHTQTEKNQHGPTKHPWGFSGKIPHVPRPDSNALGLWKRLEGKELPLAKPS